MSNIFVAFFFSLNMITCLNSLRGGEEWWGGCGMEACTKDVYFKQFFRAILECSFCHRDFNNKRQLFW